MPIIPNGFPAWTRAVSIAHYDGHANKHNFLSVGVIDPETDLGAAGFARLTADLAACVRVAPFCELDIQCNDTSPAAPTILRAYMQTAVRETSYAGNAAPSGFPSAARNGNGDITITFASTYADEYAVSAAFSVAMPQASIKTGYGFVLYELPTATTVRLRARQVDGVTAQSDALIRFSCMSGA